MGHPADFGMVLRGMHNAGKDSISDLKSFDFRSNADDIGDDAIPGPERIFHPAIPMGSRVKKPMKTDSLGARADQRSPSFEVDLIGWKLTQLEILNFDKTFALEYDPKCHFCSLSKYDFCAEL